VKKQCSTCRFFGGSACRLVPPVVIANGETHWPSVSPDDFCGEWREMIRSGPVGRPFAVKEDELIAIVRQCIGDGATLAELHRGLTERSHVRLSPSALFARLKRLVELEVLVKDGTRYHMASDDPAHDAATPTVEVD